MSGHWRHSRLPLNEVFARRVENPGHGTCDVPVRAWRLGSLQTARAADWLGRGGLGERLFRSLPELGNSRQGPTTGVDHADDADRRLCSLDQSKVVDRSVLGSGARMWKRTLGPLEQPRTEGGGLKREAMCRVQRVEPA
jgi:hypothetical protein